MSLGLLSFSLIVRAAAVLHYLRERTDYWRAGGLFNSLFVVSGLLLKSKFVQRIRWLRDVVIGLLFAWVLISGMLILRRTYSSREVC